MKETKSVHPNFIFECQLIETRRTHLRVLTPSHLFAHWPLSAPCPSALCSQILILGFVQQHSSWPKVRLQKATSAAPQCRSHRISIFLRDRGVSGCRCLITSSSARLLGFFWESCRGFELLPTSTPSPPAVICQARNWLPMIGVNKATGLAWRRVSWFL